MGMKQLMDAEGQGKVMQHELEALQPLLLKASKDTFELLKKVELDREAAQKTRSIVEAEEAIAKVKADEANQIKTECEADLVVMST
ncbi:unnamed protein product [Calypogeia fissa]